MNSTSLKFVNLNRGLKLSNGRSYQIKIDSKSKANIVITIITLMMQGLLQATLFKHLLGFKKPP